MPAELRGPAAFALALALALVTVLIARHVAWRTGFLDRPVDYKAHARATPYLGGAAVMASFLLSALLLGSGAPRFAVVIALALGLSVMGTIDDKRTLRPSLRLGVQLFAGLVLWLAGIRWEVVGQDWIDLPITMIWVAGLANAFNLLDNIDGATGTTGAVSAAGIGAIFLVQDAPELAAVAFALSGACVGFLRFNLASPAQIFLGDGGSLPIGFLVAALAMLIPSDLGQESILAAAPLAGVAIFDTTLVVFSRTRHGISILTGGRDHSTHRLLGVLGSPIRVALVLGLTQAALCGLALLMQELTQGVVVAISAIGLGVGGAALALFEGRGFAPKSAAEQSA